jgi:hypothetical protein
MATITIDAGDEPARNIEPETSQTCDNLRTVAAADFRIELLTAFRAR